MPYIRKEDRLALDTYVEALSRRISYQGELNYVVTRLVERYVEDLGLNYANLNTAIGVLECAKLELYRRLVASYEDQKRAENGDVYHLLEGRHNG